MAHILGGNHGNALLPWPPALPILEAMSNDLNVTNVR